MGGPGPGHGRPRMSILISEAMGGASAESAALGGQDEKSRPEASGAGERCEERAPEAERGEAQQGAQNANAERP